MFKNFLIALKVSLFTIFITGIIYPVFVTGAANILFHDRATGSFILDESDHIIGSELIGQNFTNPAYFFSRPSAAGEGYDGMRSGGSNLGPTSKKLVQKIHERIEKIRGFNTEPIPIDLVTSSGSGLDPHISLNAAYWQAPKVALEREVSLKRVISIIDNFARFPQFYLLGSPRVNVVKLNQALDQFFGPPPIKGG